MFGFGFPELLVVMAVSLLLFGNKLPTFARSLGRSLVEFRREVHAIREDVDPRLP